MKGCKYKAFIALQFGDLPGEINHSLHNPTSSQVVSFHPNLYKKLLWGRQFLTEDGNRKLIVLKANAPLSINNVEQVYDPTSSHRVNDDQLLGNHLNGTITKETATYDVQLNGNLHVGLDQNGNLDINDNLAYCENSLANENDVEYHAAEPEETNGPLPPSEDKNMDSVEIKDKPKPKPTLWSQLFSNQSSKSEYVPEKSRDALAEHENMGKVSQDQFTFEVNAKLNTLSKSNLPRVAHINPRGLNNFGNNCFMHSALQVLVNLPQFFHLLIALPNRAANEGSTGTTPILDSLKEFISNFKVYRQEQRAAAIAVSRPKLASEFTIDSPFTLSRSLMSHKIVIHGQQEDVEEFLFSILDSLHEELSAVRDLYRKPEESSTNGESGNEVSSQGTELSSQLDEKLVIDSADDQDNWVSMGPKRRGRVHREVHSSESIVTQLFGGQLVTEVRKKSQKPSCTTQRFFTLRLDIKDENIVTLTDALIISFSKEVIEQNGSSEITQLSYLAKLPEILILQLKLFVYNSKDNIVEKLNKMIAFEEVLDVPAPCFGENRCTISPMSRRYKLFAVIYHHGEDANKGHYSASIFHTGQRIWLSFNDAEVVKTDLKSVLKSNIKEKVPYLLIYRKLE